MRPATLVLVHGAGSGPWVFRSWSKSFPAIEVKTPDLQEGLEVARASMVDYSKRIVETALNAAAPVALCGWSMGGLAVLMAAGRVRPTHVVLLEPSPPAEVQGYSSSPDAVLGVFDPQVEYGPFPPGMAARPESLVARVERKAGISVPTLPCPSLVIYGDEYLEIRGRAVAKLYGSEEHYLPGLNHWDLVLREDVAATIAEFLADTRMARALT